MMAQVTLKHPIMMLLQAALYCWETSHDASFLTLLSPCTDDIIVVINLSLSFSAGTFPFIPVSKAF